jgi:hypothetical protein
MTAPVGALASAAISLINSQGGVRTVVYTGGVSALVMFGLTGTPWAVSGKAANWSAAGSALIGTGADIHLAVTDLDGWEGDAFKSFKATSAKWQDLLNPNNGLPKLFSDTSALLTSTANLHYASFLLSFGMTAVAGVIITALEKIEAGPQALGVEAAKLAVGIALASAQLGLTLSVIGFLGATAGVAWTLANLGDFQDLEKNYKGDSFKVDPKQLKVDYNYKNWTRDPNSARANEYEDPGPPKPEHK